MTCKCMCNIKIVSFYELVNSLHSKTFSFMNRSEPYDPFKNSREQALWNCYSGVQVCFFKSEKCHRLKGVRESLK